MRKIRGTTQSLSDLLVRYVVRPTRGMTEGGHEKMEGRDYVRFALSLGTGGMAALLRRFINVIRAALALWREHLSDAAVRVRRRSGSYDRRASRWATIKPFSVMPDNLPFRVPRHRRFDQYSSSGKQAR